MTTPYRILLAIAALLFGLALYMSFALAQPAALPANCFQWQQALQAVKVKYGETPAYIATATNGVVLTVTVNPETGTWTLWGQRNPDVMCALAAGKGWEVAPDSIAHPPPPAPQMWRRPDGKGGVLYILPADTPDIRHPPSY